MLRWRYDLLQHGPGGPCVDCLENTATCTACVECVRVVRIDLNGVDDAALWTIRLYPGGRLDARNQDLHIVKVDVSRRVVEHAQANAAGVHRVWILQIQIYHIVDKNLKLRQKAVPKVEAMIEDAIRAFIDWEKEMQITPAIKALRERFEEIRKEELTKNLKRIPEDGREAATRLTESLVNRLLHEPTVTLRRASRNPGGGRDLVAALRRLFGMGGRNGGVND